MAVGVAGGQWAGPSRRLPRGSQNPVSRGRAAGSWSPARRRRRRRREVPAPRGLRFHHEAKEVRAVGQALREPGKQRRRHPRELGAQEGPSRGRGVLPLGIAARDRTHPAAGRRGAEGGQPGAGRMGQGRHQASDIGHRAGPGVRLPASPWRPPRGGAGPTAVRGAEGGRAWDPRCVGVLGGGPREGKGKEGKGRVSACSPSPPSLPPPPSRSEDRRVEEGRR